MLKEGINGQSILKWIEENVPEDIREDVTFSRHSVRCILQTVSTNSSGTSRDVEDMEKQSFQEFCPILKLLLTTTFLQQNCLFEVQLFGFNANFPKGLMERLFEYLSMFEIVKPEVFIMWEEDDGVVEGKKETLAQTKKMVKQS